MVLSRQQQGVHRCVEPPHTDKTAEASHKATCDTNNQRPTPHAHPKPRIKTAGKRDTALVCPWCVRVQRTRLHTHPLHKH